MAFILIEGLDGSGKSTQVRLLRKHFDKLGYKHRFIHFPRIESGIFGDLIAMFLRGDLGDIGDVNPYLVALLYAADRNDAKNEIEDWLSEGNILLVDRYVLSNIAYQGAKLESEREKTEIKEWIIQLEYNYHGIPKPDITLFLDVPFGFTREKLKNARSGNERSYLKGKKDIHESDLEFQQKVREIYLAEAVYDNSINIIDCFLNNNKMLPPEYILKKIIDLLNKEIFT